MNKEEKAKLWADRIQQCKTSGQTCKQWCAENGIPLSTMGYWTRRLAKEEPASESEQDMVFVRLPSEQEAARKLLSEKLPGSDPMKYIGINFNFYSRAGITSVFCILCG